MKNNTAAVAVAAAWGFNQSNNEMALTDVTLSNVEALAQSEWGDDHCKYCSNDFSNICWFDGLDGCLGSRLILV